MKNNCINCRFKSTATKTLRNDEIEQLNYNCANVVFKKGDIIIKQGGLSSNIVYLKTGLVKVHLHGPCYEQITKITKAPSYLGLPTTFGDKINHYSITAIEESEVCFVDIAAFKSFLSINNKFAFEIIVELCKNELSSFQRCVNRTQKQVRGNIAEAILFFADVIYQSDEFILPLSRAEFGNLIDASRESISRVLSEFNDDGIIRLSGKGMCIINKKSLELISENG